VTPAHLLLDEQGRPTLRQRVGQLLSSAEEAAFAVRRIRLAVLDLTDQELGTIRRCRVLLGQLDASMLLDAAEAGAAGPGSGALGGLFRFVRSGRVEVRSAGLAAWTPDFGLVHTPAGPVGLVGSIQFGNPELNMGPSFTVVLTDPDSALRLGARFDELWDRAHDVLPAIRQVLERADGVGDAAGAGGGGPHAGGAVRG
jgi:hypothetical protein